MRSIGHKIDSVQPKRLRRDADRPCLAKHQTERSTSIEHGGNQTTATKENHCYEKHPINLTRKTCSDRGCSGLACRTRNGSMATCGPKLGAFVEYRPGDSRRAVQVESRERATEAGTPERTGQIQGQLRYHPEPKRTG